MTSVLFNETSINTVSSNIVQVQHCGKTLLPIFQRVTGVFFPVIVIFLHCALPIDPKKDPANVSITASLCIGPLCRTDSLSAFVGDTLTLSLDIKLPDLIDSLKVKVLPGPGVSDPMIFAAARAPSDTAFPVFFPKPCTLHVSIDALLADATHRMDTVHFLIREKPENNTAPLQSLSAMRSYAAPSLPCTVSIAATDSQAWQTVHIDLVKMPDAARIIGDSLFVWAPAVSDTGSMDTLIFIARDNSASAKADTDTVIIRVIPDETPPAIPQGLRVLQRKLKNVTLCWDRVATADYYRIYRNGTLSAEGWSLVDSTGDTSYTDETDSVFYYHVVSVNFFYRSKPSVIISGKDTLFHGITFVDSVSTVNESDSLLRIEVRLSGQLPDTLVVPYAVIADSSTAGESDFSLADTSGVLTFLPGDTSAIILICMIDDSISESGETILLRLGHPSPGLPLLTGIHRCTILPDSDPLHQRVKVSLVRLVCEMADDGTDYDIEMNLLSVAVIAAEMTADSAQPRIIVFNQPLLQYVSEADGITMTAGTQLVPPGAVPIEIPFNVDPNDPSKNAIVFNCYGSEYDASSTNDEGNATLTVTGDHFFDNNGIHGIALSSPGSFLIRVEVKIELVN